MIFSSTHNTSVQRYLNSLFQNQRSLFQLSLLFWKNISSTRSGLIKWQTNIGSLKSFRINLKNTSSHISLGSFLRALVPRKIIFNFFKLNIPPWKIFKFMVFRLLENAFVSQTIECWYFDLCPSPRQNSHPGTYHP